MSSDKKVALITGASRGIGQAIAKELASRDDLVVIGTATTEDGASGITHYFSKWGLQGDGIQLDLSDPESVDQLVQQVTEIYGAPLILINNAGITRDNILLRMKESEWDEVINTNLTSVYRMSKAFLKGMTKARWGRIVNVSSVVAQMGNPGQVNYCASKAGLEGLTRSLASEIGARNITVNAVAPGFIDTDMTQALDEKVRDGMLQRIPLRRLGKPEEVATVVSFLVSEPAAYITGETIHINGGMYMG